MKTPEQKAAHAAYMRVYTRANADEINAQRRARHAANPTRKQTTDARYRAKKREVGRTAEEKAAAAAQMRARRAANPEAARAVKQRYYASDKGRAQKKKEDAAFIASGGRSKAEARRAAQPVSQARKDCRARWAAANKDWFTAEAARRRSGKQRLSADDFWVLQEAVLLARQREAVVGGKWHVDHILAVSKGGTSEPSNLQVVPAAWNIRKSNVHTERFFGAVR